MRKILIISLLILTCGQVFSQIDPYDPAPPVIIRQPERPNEEQKPIIPKPPNDKSKVLSLNNYPPGEFKNIKSLMFCHLVVNEIDNIMQKNNKILSINIKGFADGLKNNGLNFSNTPIRSECLKFIDFSKKSVNDEQLAILRACEIEGQLKTLLASKSYLIYVSFSNSFYDIKDGGESGNQYRKIEVLITFVNKKM